MTQSACPHLTCEKKAFRGILDLTDAPRLKVILTWYCEHPFHGIRLELGDARGDMETLCAACSLPRPDGEES
jgi:hypothetical protein